MASSTDPPADGPLSARELAAWRGMLRAHAQVTRELDAQMRAEHGLSISSYEVLLFLGSADGHRLRMADIASRVLLSRSGLTRLVDRLASLGYVTREESTDDGRGLWACLTPAGADKLAAARALHHRGVREVFLDRLSPADQTALGEIWARVVGDGA